MTTIGFTGQAVTYVVQTTGLYDIVAYGAQGGSNGGGAGGLGAEIGSDFSLTTGETLTIAVSGQSGVFSYGASGGGGGFVVGPSNTELVIGGGDGTSGNPGGTAGNGFGGGGGAGEFGSGGNGGGYRPSDREGVRNGHGFTEHAVCQNVSSRLQQDQGLHCHFSKALSGKMLKIVTDVRSKKALKMLIESIFIERIYLAQLHDHSVYQFDNFNRGESKIIRRQIALITKIILLRCRQCQPISPACLSSPAPC